MGLYPDLDEEDDACPCSTDGRRVFVCSDEGSFGEGRCYCELCGADGDG